VSIRVQLPPATLNVPARQSACAGRRESTVWSTNAVNSPILDAFPVAHRAAARILALGDAGEASGALARRTLLAVGAVADRKPVLRTRDAVVQRNALREAVGPAAGGAADARRLRLHVLVCVCGAV